MDCAQYDVGMLIPGTTTADVKIFDPIAIVETELRSQGIDGLLGRDVLSEFLVVYDGKRNVITLAF